MIGSVAVFGAGVIAGLFAWLGAKLQGVDPGSGRMLGAGTNLVPTALVVLCRFERQPWSPGESHGVDHSFVTGIS